jgi:hypothetical protein
MRSRHQGSWWLKVTGRPYDEFWAQLAAVTMLLRPRYDLPAPIHHEVRGDAAPLSQLSEGRTDVATPFQRWRRHPLATAYLMPLVYLGLSLK